MPTPFEVFDAHEALLESYCGEWGMEIGFGKMKEARLADDRGALIDIANKVWFALPDRKEIRTPGFFKLCDIAEGMFDDDE